MFKQITGELALFDVFDPARLPPINQGNAAILDHAKKVVPCIQKLMPEIDHTQYNTIIEEFYHLLYNLQELYDPEYDLAITNNADATDFWTDFMTRPSSDVLFKSSIKTLILRTLVIPIGSAGVERIISDYNVLKTPLRNRFLVETIDDHLFVRRNGPELAALNLSPILKLWRKNHRSSGDPKQVRKPTEYKEPEIRKSSIWS